MSTTGRISKATESDTRQAIANTETSRWIPTHAHTQMPGGPIPALHVRLEIRAQTKHAVCSEGRCQTRWALTATSQLPDDLTSNVGDVVTAEKFTTKWDQQGLWHQNRLHESCQWLLPFSRIQRLLSALTNKSLWSWLCHSAASTVNRTALIQKDTN